MVRFNLCTIVKDITDQYILEEYCKHYSKYDVEKVFVMIHSEGGEYVDFVKSVFQKYFSNVEIKLSMYDNYSIEEESFYFTEIYNYRLKKNQWLMISDIDEFVEIEKIKNNVFVGNNLICGILIDRLKKESQVFDESKSIFENYPDKYFIFNKIKTSYPFKIVFIKKIDKYLKIQNGHHKISISDNDSVYIKKEKKYLPVHHFKWTKNFLFFIKNSLLNNKHSSYNEIYADEIKKQLDTFSDKTIYSKISSAKLHNDIDKIYIGSYIKDVKEFLIKI